MIAKDYTGYISPSGFLTAIRPALAGRRMWIVECKCGNIVTIRGCRIKYRTSCGCQAQANRLSGLRKKITKHGLAGSRPYLVWVSMKNRCNNPNDRAWYNYGARGIKVCQRWVSFECFWEDMGPSYRSGLSLERRDNNKGYSKANCYWATRLEQQQNTRWNKLVSTPWGMLCASEAARRAGLNVSTILHRLRAGWLESDILKPSQRKRP